MKIRWRISLSLVWVSAPSWGGWDRVARCVGAGSSASSSSSPPSSSALSVSNPQLTAGLPELQSEPKLRLKLEAEFEFWVEHLNAADLISVTRRLGRRRRRRLRRCHDDERKNLSYPHARQQQQQQQPIWVAVAAIAFFFFFSVALLIA